MTQLGYKRTILLRSKEDSNQEKKRLVTLFISEFQEEKLAVGKDADVLTFERKIQITTNIRENIFQLFQPLKKGHVTLTVEPNKRIKAVIFVGLKFHLLLSLYACLAVVGIMLLQGNVTLYDGVWILIAFIMAFVVFFIQNKLKVDRILRVVMSSFRSRRL